MDHFLAAKTVVGSGDSTILLEVRGGSVRIKRRGQPDLFVPLDVAGEVGRFLVESARAKASASARGGPALPPRYART